MRKSFLNIAVFVLIAFSLSALPSLNKDMDEASFKQQQLIIDAEQNKAISQATKLIIQNPADDKMRDGHLTIDQKATKSQQPQLKHVSDKAIQQLTILPNGSQEDIFVNVYNSIGNMVKVCKVNPDYVNFSLPLDGLNQGIYVVKLINGSKVIETRKIIINS